jgi:hypothetical protein
MWGPHRPVINSQETSLTNLALHLSAIVACFVFWREICHPALSDFIQQNLPLPDSLRLGLRTVGKV